MFFKQKTAYEMRISDWSSDVCSSDLFDFKIEMKDEVSVLISRSDVGNDGKNTKTIRFEEPKRLLFLRIRNVHPLYMSSTRTQTGKTGLNEETKIGRASCRERVCKYV